MAPKVVEGQLGIYSVQNTGIIDYELLKLRNLYLNAANGEFDKETLSKLRAIRREQDLLLDARLEHM